MILPRKGGSRWDQRCLRQTTPVQGSRLNLEFGAQPLLQAGDCSETAGNTFSRHRSLDRPKVAARGGLHHWGRSLNLNLGDIRLRWTRLPWTRIEGGIDQVCGQILA